MTNRDEVNKLATKITGETVKAETTKGALEAISGKKAGSIAQAINDIVKGDIPGGGADLEDNKEVTITENGTVEITPTVGKDGMKKVTATVDVSGGINTLFAWQESRDNLILYTTTATPTTSDKCYVPGETGHEIEKTDILSVGDGYITIEEVDVREFARYSTGDISLT